jgi:hypothetical protein
VASEVHELTGGVPRFVEYALKALVRERLRSISVELTVEGLRAMCAKDAVLWEAASSTLVMMEQLNDARDWLLGCARFGLRLNIETEVTLPGNHTYSVERLVSMFSAYVKHPDPSNNDIVELSLPRIVVDKFTDAGAPPLRTLKMLLDKPLARRDPLFLASLLEESVEESLHHRVLAVARTDLRPLQLMSFMSLPETRSRGDDVSEEVLSHPKVASSRGPVSRGSSSSVSASGKTVHLAGSMRELLRLVGDKKLAVLRRLPMSWSPDVLLLWDETLVGFACKSGTSLSAGEWEEDVSKFKEMVSANPKGSPIKQFKLVLVAPRMNVGDQSESLKRGGGEAKAAEASGAEVESVVLGSERREVDGKTVASECEQLLGPMFFKEFRRVE